MEQEILEELEKIYKNFKIEVKFIDFRIYEISVKFELNNKTYEFKFEYTWNVGFTKNYNISIILYKIDKQIIKIFKGDEEND